MLRAEVERLREIAAGMVAKCPAYSRDWYALTNAVAGAEFALTFQALDGFAGALNVAEFARQIRVLTGVIGS